VRPDEREVAGLTCSAVMSALSEYVDGELPAELVARVEAHVAECRQCEQFGAGFARLLNAMRRQMAEPEPVTHEMLARLRVALRA
jgi:predicted anti-sigma-YlaC factor YlaD